MEEDFGRAVLACDGVLGLLLGEVAVVAFPDDAGAGGVAARRVGSMGEVSREGENAAWAVTWRRAMLMARVNDSRSGSSSAWSAASVMSWRIA